VDRGTRGSARRQSASKALGRVRCTPSSTAHAARGAPCWRVWTFRANASRTTRASRARTAVVRYTNTTLRVGRSLHSGQTCSRVPCRARSRCCRSLQAASSRSPRPPS
jgi:hypothetical protein